MAAKSPRKAGGKPFTKGAAPGPGRPKGLPNKVTVEARSLAKAMIEDADYLNGLRTRLMEGSLAPAMESLLWHYAYGKPVESVTLSNPDGSALSGPTLTVVVQK